MALTILGIGIVLGKKTTPISSGALNSNNTMASSNSISINIDDSNIIDNIKLSWVDKRSLIIVIPDTIIAYSDSFEINPINSITCKEYIEKIEENIILIMRLYERTRGRIYFRNGGNMVPLIYRNQSESNNIKKIVSNYDVSPSMT